MICNPENGFGVSEYARLDVCIPGDISYRSYLIWGVVNLVIVQKVLIIYMQDLQTS